jgi:hypothetical protein
MTNAYHYQQSSLETGTLWRIQEIDYPAEELSSPLVLTGSNHFSKSKMDGEIPFQMTDNILASSAGQTL